MADSKIRSEIVTVTPTMAAGYLGTMRRNRSLTARRVARFAEDMKAGRWTVNGQGIIFDSDGRLIDGQHRLQAVIHADVDVTMLVTRGVPPKAWDTLDDMRARRSSDVLTAKGRRNPTLLAAVLRMIYQHELGVLGSGSREHTPTNKDIDGLDEEYPTAPDAVAWAGGKPWTKTGPVAFLRFITLTQGNVDQAREFFDGLRDGAGLEPDTPCLVAREMLLTRRGAETPIGEVALLARLIKAWNAFLAGARVKRLQWSAEDEAFPEIMLDPAKAKAAAKRKKGQEI